MADIGLVAHHVRRSDGQGRVMLEMARVLAADGHDVTVYACGIDDDLRPVVRYHPLPRLRRPKLLGDLLVVPAATRALRRAGHDSVCIMGPVGRPAVPYTYYAEFSHGGWRRTWRPDTRPSPYHRLVNAVGARRERMAADRSARLIACSELVAADFGLPAERVVVVPNGVDIDEFAPVTVERRRAARAALGVDAGDGLLVALIGEFRTTRKGLGPLLEAVAAGPGDEHLLVAGTGDVERLRRRAVERGLAGRVHAVGFRPAADVLAAADVAAVPSLYEPFSLVAAEAAASGVPLLVSSRVGALPHLAAAAVAVETPEDAGELRAALDRLRDPELRRRLALAGPPAAARLDWRIVAPQAAAVVASLG